MADFLILEKLLGDHYTAGIVFNISENFLLDLKPSLLQAERYFFNGEGINWKINGEVLLQALN